MSAYPGAAAMAAAADGGHVTPGRFPPLAPGEPGNFLVGRELIKVFIFITPVCVPKWKKIIR